MAAIVAVEGSADLGFGRNIATQGTEHTHSPNEDGG
jgi:hypothetical protein